MAGLGARLLLASTAAVVLAGPAVSAPERRYNIPSQDLGGALQAFGIQSGESVSFRAEIVDGLRSPPVVGVFGAEAALAAVLKGSRLSFLRSEHGFVILPQAPGRARVGPSPVAAGRGLPAGEGADP